MPIVLNIDLELSLELFTIEVVVIAVEVGIKRMSLVLNEINFGYVLLISSKKPVPDVREDVELLISLILTSFVLIHTYIYMIIIHEFVAKCL